MKRQSVVLSGLVTASFFFAVLLWVIWLNRDGQEVIKVLASLLLAVAAAWASFVWVIYSPLPIDKSSVKVLLPHLPGRKLLPISSPLVLAGSPRGMTYINLQSLLSEWHQRSTASRASMPEDAAGDTGFFLDLLELGTLQWISRNYQMHWMVVGHDFQGISARGGSLSAAPNAEKNVDSISAEQVSSLFNKNSLVSQGVRVSGFVLPANSRIITDRSQNGRTISVENKYIKLKIEITGVGGERLGASSLADRIGAHFALNVSQRDQVWADHFVVLFERNYERWLRGAPSTTRQKIWADKMAEMYEEEFDWEGVRSDLDKILPK